MWEKSNPVSENPISEITLPRTNLTSRNKVFEVLYEDQTKSKVSQALLWRNPLPRSVEHGIKKGSRRRRYPQPIHRVVAARRRSTPPKSASRAPFSLKKPCPSLSRVLREKLGAGIEIPKKKLKWMPKHVQRPIHLFIESLDATN